jgi:hypothetical protein
MKLINSRNTLCSPTTIRLKRIIPARTARTIIQEATANVPGGPCGRKYVVAIATSGLENFAKNLGRRN